MCLDRTTVVKVVDFLGYHFEVVKVMRTGDIECINQVLTYTNSIAMCNLLCSPSKYRGFPLISQRVRTPYRHRCHPRIHDSPRAVVSRAYLEGSDKSRWECEALTSRVHDSPEVFGNCFVTSGLLDSIPGDILFDSMIPH